MSETPAPYVDSRESLAETVEAYDTNTGDKVTVPKAWLDHDLFPHIKKTPQAAAAARRADEKTGA